MLAMSRTKFSWLAAGAIVALTLVPLGAGAQVKGLDILVPANPGGGWDQTARAMETALQANDLASGIQVTNVGGAGGTIGLAQFATTFGVTSAYVRYADRTLDPRSAKIREEMEAEGLL